MSLPSAYQLAGMTLDNTLGATFVGVVVACILFGMTTLQTYLYYHHFAKDSLLHKASVALLCGLDTVHLSLTLHAVYFYLVTNFGRFTTAIVWSLKAQIGLQVTIVLLVQALYAYRVWLLGGYHNGVLGYIVVAAVAGGFVIGVVLAYETSSLDSFDQVSTITWAVDASLAAPTAIDFIISAAMCHYLRKSKGSESRLNSRISTVMRYSLSSGLFTSTCSLAVLLAYTLSPNTLVYLGLEFILTKLYVGSFIAMLNARKRADDQAPDESQGVPSLQFTIQSLLNPGGGGASSSPGGVSPYSATSERKYPWDVDIEGQTIRSPDEKPTYMRQW